MDLKRREQRARDGVARTHHDGPDNRRKQQYATVIMTSEEADDMGSDQPNEPDKPGKANRGTRQQRRKRKQR